MSFSKHAVTPAQECAAANPRGQEAARLRRVIQAKGKAAVSFGAGEQAKVAALVNSFIDRYAKQHGRGSMTGLCAKLWPESFENPTRRRAEILQMKKASTLANMVDAIAQYTGDSADNLLLEAFRGTRFDRAAAALLQGIGAEPDLEEFWSVLSETLHALAAAVVRIEGLEKHQERMAGLRGGYNLGSDSFFPSSARPLIRPLANWSEHWCEFPPIPSVVLFTEPQCETVERTLLLADPEERLPVAVSVCREVRLAIGPVDHPLVPGPLFEFRSVLHLAAGGRPLQLRYPWPSLEDAEEDVEVEIDGTWRAATLLLGEDHTPTAFKDDVLGSREFWLPASLEAPVQHGHAYPAWRPVTAGTCQDLLLRPVEGACVPFQEAPYNVLTNREGPDAFLPSGSLAVLIEAALHGTGPESLPEQLRAAARQMVARLSGWHVEQAAAAESAHRTLRSRWETWS
ncbi:hypothetical protein ACFQ20_18880 [Pseudoroseomonas ludipueritiae]